MVREAIIDHNPNDPATEIWDEEAVQRLANYFCLNGYTEVDINSAEHCYFLYDLLKFTLGEMAAEAEYEVFRNLA